MPENGTPDSGLEIHEAMPLIVDKLSGVTFDDVRLRQFIARTAQDMSHDASFGFGERLLHTVRETTYSRIETRLCFPPPRPLFRSTWSRVSFFSVPRVGRWVASDGSPAPCSLLDNAAS